MIPFSFLAISLVFQMPLHITGAFFQTLNNTKLLFIESIVSGLLIVGAIILGITLGKTIDAVAMAYLIAQAVNAFQMIVVMHVFLFKESFWKFLLRFLKICLCAGAVMAGTYFLFQHINIANKWGSLFAKTGIATGAGSTPNPSAMPRARSRGVSV